MCDGGGLDILHVKTVQTSGKTDNVKLHGGPAPLACVPPLVSSAQLNFKKKKKTINDDGARTFRGFDWPPHALKNTKSQKGE